MTITQTELKNRLTYDEKTGVFTWLPRPIKHYTDYSWNARYANKQAGNCWKYWNICIDNKRYLSSKLAWLYVYGVLPSKILDHIDGNPNNNSITNLRESQNGVNKPVSKYNTSGVTGVYWNKAECKWMANVSIKSKRIHLGMFTNFNDAVAARKAGEEKYYGGFATRGA